MSFLYILAVRLLNGGIALSNSIQVSIGLDVRGYVVVKSDVSQVPQMAVRLLNGGFALSNSIQVSIGFDMRGYVVIESDVSQFPQMAVWLLTGGNVLSAVTLYIYTPFVIFIRHCVCK